MKKWLPWATMILVIVTVGAYLYFSGGQPYVHPLESMLPFGVTGGYLLGAFTYAFMHIGFKHLLGNAVVLFAVGVIVEKKIGSKHMMGLYLSSAVGAGILYSILHPEVWVVGASAAISGMVIAAYIVDLKKSALFMVIALLAIPTLVFPMTDYGLDMFQQRTSEAHIAAVMELNELESDVKEFEVKIAESTPEEMVVLQEEKELMLLELEEKSVDVKEKQLEEVTLVEGRKTEAVTPVSLEIHLIGIAFALAYLALFRKEAFSWLKRDLVDLIEPRNQKSSGRTKKRGRKALSKVSKNKRKRLPAKAKRR